MEDICVVFTSNKAYFQYFIYTCGKLIQVGNYTGQICLVIGDDLVGDKLLTCDLIKNNNIIIKYFPNIEFTPDFLDIQKHLNRPSHWYKKIFQFHKLHLFNTFFKQWNYIFYLDCGIHIFCDISPIINERKVNTLLAHSDAYPAYEWKFSNQFCNNNSELYKKLTTTFDLEKDYFQTTIMLYDTNIITSDTYEELLDLLFEYPISKTNDQGIIALYFTNIKPLFKQIKTHSGDLYYYDYLSRNKKHKYIMLKSDI